MPRRPDVDGDVRDPPQRWAERLDEALGPRDAPGEEDATLTDDLRAALERNSPEPVRTVHHFACTGGTLMSRALAAQPLTLLLSEVDPLSRLPFNAPLRFAPTDLILLAQAGPRGPDQATLEEMFLAGLQALRDGTGAQGTHLVLRDHAHSHFCVGPEVPARPTLRDLVARRFPTRGIVTVRHPLDSFLSLRVMGWVHFAPGTLEEYARRYLAFLDAYADAAVFKYESFVAAPDETTRQMAAELALAYDPDWKKALPAIRLTGDSGRSGDRIAPRPRRSVPDDIAAEAERSDRYRELCSRLDYAPDPADPRAG